MRTGRHPLKTTVREIISKEGPVGRDDESEKARWAGVLDGCTRKTDGGMCKNPGAVQPPGSQSWSREERKFHRRSRVDN